MSHSIFRVTVCLATLLLGFTPVEAGQLDLFSAIRAGDVKTVRALLKSGVNANTRTKDGVTPLLYAALNGNTSTLTALLEAGADPNIYNSFGATPLMWAASDPEKVRLLLKNGAKVDAVSAAGRNALIIAAATPGNAKTLQMLLARGADPTIADQTGEGPLGSAATVGDVEMIRILIAAGASVQERGARGQGMRGLTPLIKAASADCAECVRLLIAKGSDVAAVSAEPRIAKAGLVELGYLTALGFGAAWGNAEMIRALLDAHAPADPKDARGIAPLAFAAANESQRLEPVRLLLAAGAVDAKAKDGLTALDRARNWGDDTAMVRLLAAHGEQLPRPANALPAASEGVPPDARTAVERSVALLQKSNAKFFEKSGCIGCHHQMMAGILVGAVQRRGWRVDDALAREQLATALTVTQPFREPTLQRVQAGGAPMTGSVFLNFLAAQNHPADAWTDAIVHDVAGLQRVEGYWKSMSPRPPMEYSPFSETAYAINAIRSYAPAARKAEMDRRVARAREWLLRSTPEFTEERTM